MKRLMSAVALVGVVGAVAACNSAGGSHDADVAAIKSGEAQWVQDATAKDVGKIMGHYADDAVLMTPGEPAMSGKDAIQKGWGHMVADPALKMTFEASKVEVAASGDLAYSQGSYQMTMTDPNTKQPVQDHGSYVTVYKKQADGNWKAVSDVAVSEVPPAAPMAMPMEGKKK